MEQYYYSTSTLKTYSASQMAGLFGINVETTDISILNLNGFYPVVASTPNFDLKLYNASSTWVLVPITPSGQGAQLDFTPVAKPLPEAKENGAIELKQQGDAATAQVLTLNYLTSDVLSAVASQDLIDRPAPLQDVLDEMVAVTDSLGANLVAVDSATTVDEINNIVNPPTGIINIGRGQFGGPLDLNASNYVSFNSVSMLQSETELYAPATSSVVPYQGFPPDDFNSSGAIFATGDYLIQIRETATGSVIAEFEVPLSLDGSNEDIAF